MKPGKDAKSARIEQPDMSLGLSHARDRDREAERRELDLGLFRRMFSYTRPYRRNRNVLFLLVLLRGIQIPTIGWAISMVINGPVAEGNWRGAVVGALAFLGLCVFTQLTMHYRQLIALRLGESAVFDLRRDVFNHLLAQPMSFYHRFRLGRLLSRVTSDIEVIRAGIQNVLFVSMVQGAQMLGAAVFMAWYNWRLFLAILFMSPLMYMVHTTFRKRISEAARAVQASFSRVTSSLAESVKGIRVTQGFVREDINAGIFTRLVQDHSRYNLNVTRNTSIYLPLLELNGQLFLGVTLALAGWGALQAGWDTSVGDLVAFFFLSNIFFSPIMALGNQFQSALASMAGAERVFRLLDTPPDWRDAPDAVEAPPLRGEVRFDKVDFSYDGKNQVLREIDFTARPGQSVALVGHTGSGKTTIIQLLSKFYQPTGGRILLDGMDLATLTGSSVHEQMGMVLQQNFLFAGTLLENIRLGKPEAGDEEVRRTLADLECLDLIEAMPEGLQTRISENGQGLSLGQRQIVCFARALISDPRILILDEATSSVDTITEARLQKALGKLLTGRTSFVVAHRLSTIRQADQILVLDHGRIIERGNHDSLMSAEGTYARLYQQFARRS
ncbi:MAG: ABC transporter ATP-binding protein [Oceanipulchritudo sp.]